MPRNTELIEKRNSDILKKYKQLKTKYPQWRIDALVKKVAEDFYLSDLTVFKILKEQ